MSHLKYTNYEGFGERAKKDIHYSQAVRIGDFIEISGQGGWDRITEEIPKEMDKQLTQAFDNVEHTLKEAGGTGWEQVYKIRAYFAPLDMTESGILIDLLRKYCPNHQPTMTAFGVEKLAFENMRIEIEVSAYLGS